MTASSDDGWSVNDRRVFKFGEFICHEMELVEIDDDYGGLDIILRFDDIDGRQHECAIPRAQLGRSLHLCRRNQTDARAVTATLLASGLELDPAKRDEILEYIQIGVDQPVYTPVF